MKFKIEGIHCDACITLISMDLEDIEVVGFQLEKDSGILTVDDKYKNQKSDIINAIKNSGEYTATEM